MSTALSVAEILDKLTKRLAWHREKAALSALTAPAEMRGLMGARDLLRPGVGAGRSRRTVAWRRRCPVREVVYDCNRG